MSATDTLKSEHTQIKTMLAVLDAICKRVASNDLVDTVDLTQLVWFFQSYADALHHAREEDVLFKVIEQADISGETDFVGVLTAEHTLARIFVSSMADEVQSMIDGETAGDTDFVDFAQSYITLLLHHICKEDNALFPMVESKLTRQQLDNVERRFKKIDNQPRFRPEVLAQHSELVDRLRASYGFSEEIMSLCK
jgi:hemerythrin-like domain-containing protein